MKHTAFKIMGMVALVAVCASSPSIRDQIDTTAFQATGISIFQPVEQQRLTAFNHKVSDLREQFNDPLYGRMAKNNFQRFDYTQEEMKDPAFYEMAMEDLKFDELNMSINKRLEVAQEKVSKPVVIVLDDSKSEKLIRIIPEEDIKTNISPANVLSNMKEIRTSSLSKTDTPKKSI